MRSFRRGFEVGKRVWEQVTKRKRRALNALVEYEVDDTGHPTVVSLHLEDSDSSAVGKGALLLDGVKKMRYALLHDVSLSAVSLITIASGYAARNKDRLEQYGFVFDNEHPLAKDAFMEYHKSVHRNEWGLSNIDEQDHHRAPAFAWMTRERFIGVFGDKKDI